MTSPGAFAHYEKCQLCGKQGRFPEPICGSCVDTLQALQLPAGLGYEDPYEASPEDQEEFGVIAGVLLRSDSKRQFVVPSKILENEAKARQKMIEGTRADDHEAHIEAHIEHDKARRKAKGKRPYDQGPSTAAWEKLGRQVRSFQTVLVVIGFLLGIILGFAGGSLLFLVIGGTA